MKEKLTQKRLKEILNYNPCTGIFTYLKRASRKTKKGDIAGSDDGYGYLVITIDNKKYRAHRLVFLYVDGYFPENHVDHINRIKSDNRLKNLRVVSAQCNVRNSKLREDNTSGIKGVVFNKQYKKWYANIFKNNKQKHIGTYNSKVEAAMARWKLEVELGYPNCISSSSAYIYLKERNLI